MSWAAAAGPSLAAVAGLALGAVLPSSASTLARRLSADWEREARLTLGMPESAPAAAPAGEKATWRRRALSACGLAAIWGGIVAQAGLTPQAGMYCAFVAVLLALALIDLDYFLLPDLLTLPLLWAGLLWAAAGASAITLSLAVWGAAFGYVSLWAFYWAFKLVTGKEGLGYGDFKLLAAFGAWFGPLALLPIMIGASVTGAVVGTVQAVRRGGKSEPLPFGPSMALAAAAYLFVQVLPAIAVR